MILEPGEWDRTLPGDFDRVECVFLDELTEQGFLHCLIEVSTQEIMAMRDKVKVPIEGFPVYFSADGLLRFYPVPNKAYTVKLRYTPKTKEL